MKGLILSDKDFSSTSGDYNYLYQKKEDQLTEDQRIAALEARVAALETALGSAGGSSNSLSADRRFAIGMLAKKVAAGDKTALQEYNRKRRKET